MQNIISYLRHWRQDCGLPAALTATFHFPTRWIWTTLSQEKGGKPHG
jgi:hypothetical protein